jgi:hypothetical protein
LCCAGGSPAAFCDFLAAVGDVLSIACGSIGRKPFLREFVL